VVSLWCHCSNCGDTVVTPWSLWCSLRCHCVGSLCSVAVVVLWSLWCHFSATVVGHAGGTVVTACVTVVRHCDVGTPNCTWPLARVSTRSPTEAQPKREGPKPSNSAGQGRQGRLKRDEWGRRQTSPRNGPLNAHFWSKRLCELIALGNRPFCGPKAGRGVQRTFEGGVVSVAVSTHVAGGHSAASVSESSSTTHGHGSYPTTLRTFRRRRRRRARPCETGGYSRRRGPLQRWPLASTTVPQSLNSPAILSL